MIYSNHALDIEQIQVLRGVIGDQTFCNGRATQIIYRLHFQKKMINFIKTDIDRQTWMQIDCKNWRAGKFSQRPPGVNSFNENIGK